MLLFHDDLDFFKFRDDPASVSPRSYVQSSGHSVRLACAATEWDFRRLSFRSFRCWQARLRSVVISLAVGESWSLHPSAKGLWALAYLIVLGSVVAFTAYTFVLSKLPAARANTYTLVNPVIALVAGNLILDEPITPEIIPATVLILGGLVISLCHAKPQ